MTADYWDICPRCVKRAQAREGPVVDPEDYRTFREDYEFYGAEDGEVVASYGGECSKCGLTCQFKHSHPIPDIDA